MLRSSIYCGLLLILTAAFSARAETCFESNCHVDEDGTLWCNNQEITAGGHCNSCFESYCIGCVNCDYTVPIECGDEIVLDNEPFVRCGNEALPPQYYSGYTGGIPGNGDAGFGFFDQYYGNHSDWYIQSPWWE
jgi:hypothetical protein